VWKSRFFHFFHSHPTQIPVTYVLLVGICPLKNCLAFAVSCVNIWIAY
jgi:hypothetical protein